MSCPDPQTISAFADGELEAKEAADVERHVAQCANCRESIEEMRWLEQRGRAALEAIEVGEAASHKVVYLKPFWLRWARPMPLAAAAAAAVAMFIGGSLVFGHLGSRQTASLPRQAVGASSSSVESEDAAFAQWLAPYRELNIPLVPMEVAANYNPAPVLPTRPDNIERN